MSSIGLIGHGPHSSPQPGFLPIGLSIAVLVLATLTAVLWYGCGWLFNCGELWRDYRNAEQMRPPAIVAPNEVNEKSPAN